MPDKPPKFGANAASALLALAATEKPPPGQCPTGEEIAAWHAKALAGDDAARVQAHVPHCQRCLNLWTGMLESTGVLEPATSRPGGWWPGFTPLWRRPALVASVVITLGLAGVLLQQPFSGPPLVAYELQIDDRMSQRGGAVAESGTGVVYGAGDTFTLTLRPQTAVDEPVEVRLFADSGSGAMPLDMPPPRVAPSGALQISGIVGDNIQLPVGASTLFVLVGREGEFPDIERAVDALDGRRHTVERDWSAWRLKLEVQPAAAP